MLPRVDTLSDGENSPERLMESLLEALVRHDTLTLVKRAVSRAEWAWIYYPSSRFSHGPFEMPADVLWHLTVQSSDKGLRRLLRAFGGVSLTLDSMVCAQREEVGPATRAWRQCLVTYRVGGVIREGRLVGALLEHRGAFKLLSYANDF